MTKGIVVQTLASPGSANNKKLHTDYTFLEFSYMKLVWKVLVLISHAHK